MSLKPQPPRPLPPEIAAWGAKHLAVDSPYRLVGETLYTQFHDADFLDLYHREGKPGLSPVLLALVTVFQALENLSDAAAANAVRTRLDWKYALHLPIDDAAFDASVLCEFRARLIAHHAETRVFDAVVEQIAQLGLLKQRGTQRTDSTHVLAKVRALNRLETVGEAMRATLNALAVAAPEWLQAHAAPEWPERYGPRFAEGRLPESQAKRQALAEQIGRDGRQLLQLIYAPGAPKELCAVPAVDILRQIWVQQFYLDGDQVQWRAPTDLPPATVAINSPYDADARYSSKRSTIWVGYKVHLSETCDAGLPRVITNVELTRAPIADTTMTDTIHDHLADADRLPATHLMDAGYIDAEHLVASQRDPQVDLVGPVPVDPSWQAHAGKGLDAAAFVIDWEAEVATCPGGKRSRRWREEQDGNGNPTIHIEFAAADCRNCPLRPDCTRSERRGRQLNIRRREAQQALQAARERQKTSAFKEQYAQRAGMEGTLSRGVRTCGLRRSRYVGKEKTYVQEVFVATALNVARVATHLADPTPAKKRIPAFVRVMGPVAAA